MKLGNIALWFRHYRNGLLRIVKDSIRYQIKKRNAASRSELIVSLTTFGARAKTVKYTIKSIILGDILPKFIVLYASEDELKVVTNSSKLMVKLIENGILQLRIVPDIRSYKKLVYALSEFKTSSIVICDDDVLYPRFWLKNLLDKHLSINNPKVVVCSRAHQISVDSNGYCQQYSKWTYGVNHSTESSKSLFPTGVGGVLYPPGSISSSAIDVAGFQQICPTCDDIWFWFCALEAGSSFITTDLAFLKAHYPDVPSSQSGSLFIQNTAGGGNDKQMKLACSRFGKLYMDCN